jgi:hypothetical protein
VRGDDGRDRIRVAHGVPMVRMVGSGSLGICLEEVMGEGWLRSVREGLVGEVIPDC